MKDEYATRRLSIVTQVKLWNRLIRNEHIECATNESSDVEHHRISFCSGRRKMNKKKTTWMREANDIQTPRWEHWLESRANFFPSNAATWSQNTLPASMQTQDVLICYFSEKTNYVNEFHSSNVWMEDFIE